jgi:hypothetical protein
MGKVKNKNRYKQDKFVKKISARFFFANSVDQIDCAVMGWFGAN